MTNSNYKGGLRAASPETRQRVARLGGKATKGRKLTEEHKRKLREAYLRNKAKKENN